MFGKQHLHGVASDYWALGVTAYELLHAERPYPRHCPHAYINYLEDALKVRLLPCFRATLLRVYSTRCPPTPVIFCCFPCLCG